MDNGILIKLTTMTDNLNRMGYREPTMEEIIKIRDNIMAKIKKEKDDRVKEVGDRVKIWDGSGNHDKNTKEHRYGIDELFKSEGIVIACGLSVPSISKYDHETKYIFDLLIKFPNGEEVYTNSKFVKRTDKHKD